MQDVEWNSWALCIAAVEQIRVRVLQLERGKGKYDDRWDGTFVTTISLYFFYFNNYNLTSHKDTTSLDGRI